MQTIILSDLHLGDGGDYEIFAGETELPPFIDSLAGLECRVFLNGDSVDFLTNEDPFDSLDVSVAIARARAIVDSRASSAVLAAFGRFLARGGELTIKLGNHDVELSLPEVQRVFREALAQPPAVSARLDFVLGNEPSLIVLGDQRVLVTHGEHADAMNKIPYLRSSEGVVELARDFRYPPGSRLVKEFLNPLKKQHRMRYMDLLKPDFQGAILTGMATNPAAMRVLFRRASLTVAWDFLKNRRLPLAFDADEGTTDDQALTLRLLDAQLDPDEVSALEAALSDSAGNELAAFDDDDGTLSRARQKLLQKGLEAYAKLHRSAAARGDDFFSLEPDESELLDVRRLAKKYDAAAVVEGHTHAARWFRDSQLVYANTGTWIPLMRLPDVNSNDFEWGAFLDELKKNPGLVPERQVLAKVETRFHFVRLDSASRSISLEEQRDGQSQLLSRAVLGSPP